MNADDIDAKNPHQSNHREQFAKSEEGRAKSEKLSISSLISRLSSLIPFPPLDDLCGFFHNRRQSAFICGFVFKLILEILPCYLLGMGRGELFI